MAFAKGDWDNLAKSSADGFYELMKSQSYRILSASPDKILGVEIREGDWDTIGSVIIWKFIIQGEVETIKEKIEIDDANKKVTGHLVIIEGPSFDPYKTLKIIKKVTPKSEGGGVVALTLVYEKRRNDSPEPHKYLQFFTALVKDIDAHLSKEKI